MRHNQLGAFALGPDKIEACLLEQVHKVLEAASIDQIQLSEESFEGVWSTFHLDFVFLHPSN